MCGRPLEVTQLALGLCDGPECRRVGLVERTLAQARQQRRQIEAEAQALRDRAVQRTRTAAQALRERGAEIHVLDEAASFPIVTIPSFDRQSARTPRRRRSLLRTHVARLVAEVSQPATTSGPIEVQSQPDGKAERAGMGAVLREACAICRGACCRAGGDHAYLTEATIRRYRDAHPGRGSGEVVNDYVSRIPLRAYRDSCIYHAPGGCALPRDMRSDTCNAFFCESLRSFRAGGETPVRAFFASVRNGAVHAGGFVSADSLRLVRRRGPAGRP